MKTHIPENDKLTIQLLESHVAALEARCAWQAGMLEALKKAHKALNAVSGASMNSNGIVWPAIQAIDAVIEKAEGA